MSGSETPSPCRTWLAHGAEPRHRAIVRSLRLAALDEASDEFDSTLASTRGWTDDTWRTWIDLGALHVVEDSEGPCGLAAGVPHSSDRTSIFVQSVWVDPRVRGRGMAERLIIAVLRHAQQNGRRQAWLHVRCGNGRAQRFYERIGFRPTGVVLARERDGREEVEMSMALDRPIG